MTAPAIPLANMTSVCSDCGAVFWTADGHSCSGRAEGQCPGCGVLQRQIDALADQLAALDRGLVEAGTTANDALAATADLKRWRDKQEKAWTTFSEGTTAAEKARDDQQDAARSAARRRTRARTSRPAAASSHLSVVAPGGAA